MTQPLRKSGMLVSHILRGCENKRRFPDEYVVRAVGQQVAADNDRKMYFYKCTLCRGYHLTTNKQNSSYFNVQFAFPPTPR